MSDYGDFVAQDRRLVILRILRGVHERRANQYVLRAALRDLGYDELVSTVLNDLAFLSKQRLIRAVDDFHCEKSHAETQEKNPMHEPKAYTATELAELIGVPVKDVWNARGKTSPIQGSRAYVVLTAMTELDITWNQIVPSRRGPQKKMARPELETPRLPEVMTEAPAEVESTVQPEPTEPEPATVDAPQAVSESPDPSPGAPRVDVDHFARCESLAEIAIKIIPIEKMVAEMHRRIPGLHLTMEIRP